MAPNPFQPGAIGWRKPQKGNSMNFPRSLRLILLSVALAGCQQQAAESTPLTEDQKAIYAYGAAIGQQVGQQAKQLSLTPEELKVFQSGFTDAMEGKPPAIKIADYEAQFKTLAEGRIAAAATAARKQGTELLASAAKETGAVTTGSGLVYRTLTAGSGESPKAGDAVKVHYHGTLPDGQVFDSSVNRGEPAEFPLSQVIPCWNEGLQLMKVGEKAKLVCPASIAYGDRGAGGTIPPGATLIFEVELLGIKPSK
jgi:FKBP-type peptidyl-prolyl cis-trans isomerase FkpA